MIAGMEIARAAADPSKYDLLALRTRLVQAIDPYLENANSFHDFLLRQTTKAVEEGE